MLLRISASSEGSSDLPFLFEVLSNLLSVLAFEISSYVVSFPGQPASQSSYKNFKD